MRELFHLGGTRQRVDTIDDALRIVRESYPGAHKQGAVGAWSFYYPTCEDGNMVGEAWMMQGRNPGWWLVVKAPNLSGAGCELARDGRRSER